VPKELVALAEYCRQTALEMAMERNLALADRIDRMRSEMQFEWSLKDREMRARRLEMIKARAAA
jgi:hypothetical protein